MNITKYQGINLKSKLQRPQELRQEFQQMLALIDPSGLKTTSAIKTYNILCGIEALLYRYETISKETLLILGVSDNWEQSVEYLCQLHKQAMHQDIYNPKMIVVK